MLMIFFFCIIIVPRFVREDFENWLLLVVSIDFAGKRLSEEILHNKEQLPRDGAQLYWKLKCYEDKMYYQMHEEIFCPSNGIIDESKFNLMIYAAVIELLFGGKYRDLICKVRDMRNEIFHLKDISTCTKKFELHLNHANIIFHEFDIKLPDVLRNSDLSSTGKFTGNLDFLFFIFINAIQYPNHWKQAGL